VHKENLSQNYDPRKTSYTILHVSKKVSDLYSAKAPEENHGGRGWALGGRVG